MRKLILLNFLILLALSSCTSSGKGMFESYYEIIEQDDFQITFRVHSSSSLRSTIFSQTNERAKSHCKSNNKNYTLAYSYKTGKAAGWEYKRKYACL